MDIYDAIFSRHSVRNFNGEKVDRSRLKRCLEAARWTPSWKNLQCWSFIITEDRKKIEKMSEFRNHWLKDVPMIIVLVADPKKSGDIHGLQFFMLDSGIAMQQLMLAGVAEGLGTCWIGLYDEAVVKELFGIPDNLRVVALTPIGTPADGAGVFNEKRKKEAAGRSRIDFSELFFEEKWGEPAKL